MFATISARFFPLFFILLFSGLSLSKPCFSREALDSQQADQPEEKELPKLPDPKGAKRLDPKKRVWIDKENKTVIVDGYISLREGMLEMFACPKGTKEHESVVAVESSAQLVHAALLALGAKTGHPVKWNPEFVPPTGTEISITVHWQNPQKKWEKIVAQEWIREIRSGKKMKYPWVFAGSGFWTDERTGEKFYMAESGDFICVSNFSTATLDIPAESSQVNDGLLFEAFTDLIPPLGTPVRLVLKPKLEKESAPEKPKS